MPSGVKQFQSALMTRLQRGEHLVLCGPCGSGKSTLLAKLYAHFMKAGVPCALSPTTTHLDDITRAFARAYPDVDTAVMARRKARARLRMAADLNEGVLLLDHVTDVSMAMIGFLRRLRGGIAGVVLAVDIEKKSDCQRLRHRHLGTSTWSMPPLSARQLRRLFRSCCAERHVPHVIPDQERQILRAARGRPGWIVQCVRLISGERYWRDELLRASLLCVDTEIALRQGHLKLLPSESARHIGAESAS